MENIFEQFTITILRLNKLVHRIKTYEMQEYGLKTIHVMCSYYLRNHAEGLTASELTKLTLEDKAAISRALKTMQEKGYVNYDPKKYNAVIRLTQKGQRLAAEISEKAARAVEAGSYQFTEEERLSFYQSLSAIAKNLEAYYDGLVGKEAL